MIERCLFVFFFLLALFSAVNCLQCKEGATNVFNNTTQQELNFVIVECNHTCLLSTLFFKKRNLSGTNFTDFEYLSGRCTSNPDTDCYAECDDEKIKVRKESEGMEIVFGACYIGCCDENGCSKASSLDVAKTTLTILSFLPCLWLGIFH